jgi:hypothetical protein
MTETKSAAKLVKRGAEWVVVLDGELLRDLGLDENTPLKVSTDGESLVISPSDPERQRKFRAALDDTIAKYPNMMPRLAE